LAYRKTALRLDEVLKTIVVPRGISAAELTRKAAWFKVSKRREMDISTVAGAFVVDVDTQNVIRHARLGYGGVAAMPSRAKKDGSNIARQEVERRDSSKRAVGFTHGVHTHFRCARHGGISQRTHHEFAGEVFAESSEGRVPRVPDFDAGSLGLAELVPPNKKIHPPAHESAHKHVTGESIYTDDFGARRHMLEVWPVCAPHARAKILKRDTSAAKTMPGVAAVLLAEDVPGLNDVGAVRHDEILLADKEVFYHSQIIALVVGETQEACRNAAAKIVIEYEPLPPILKIEDAIAQKSFHYEPNFIRRGDAQVALKNSPQILEGEFSFGGQEHFYLEMQAAYAEPGEDGSMFVMSSTQHPSEVQHIVAHLLHVPVNHVVVQSPRKEAIALRSAWRRRLPTEQTPQLTSHSRQIQPVARRAGSVLDGDDQCPAVMPGSVGGSQRYRRGAAEGGGAGNERALEEQAGRQRRGSVGDWAGAGRREGVTETTGRRCHWR